MRASLHASARPALLSLIAGAAAIAALALPAAAPAAGGQFVEARAQIDEARVLVERAVAATEAGDRERGYDLARSAYLDHYERAEIPLRLRASNLVLDTEFAFAELRNGIRDGDSIGHVKASAREVRIGLNDAERALASPGAAAPLLAFAFSFSILFREGLEAVLLVAILLGSLAAGRASGYRRPLALGVGAALAATVLTWALATLVIDIAPLDRELLEAVTALVAVAVLFVVSYWLVARLDQRRRIEFMRARVAAAVAAGSALAFAGLGFTAVYREGFETVLFYQALALFAKGLELWVALGAVAAVVALAGVGYAILGLGKRLPIKPMLAGGAAVLMVLSVAFVGNAVRSLQEGDIVSVTPVAADWARPPLFVAELTGVHPTREGLTVQALLLAVYVATAAFLWLRYALRRRRAVEARA